MLYYHLIMRIIYMSLFVIFRMTFLKCSPHFGEVKQFSLCVSKAPRYRLLRHILFIFMLRATGLKLVAHFVNHLIETFRNTNYWSNTQKICLSSASFLYQTSNQSCLLHGLPSRELKSIKNLLTWQPSGVQDTGCTRSQISWRSHLSEFQEPSQIETKRPREISSEVTTSRKERLETILASFRFDSSK